MMGVKESYQQKADAQLQEWQAWIEQIKTGPGQSTLRGPADRQRLVERLEYCHRIAQVRLQELRSSQEGQWELAKQAVERAMIDLKRALDDSGAVQVGKYVQLETRRSQVYEPFHRKG